MTHDGEFTHYIAELLGSMGTILVRRMFGGHGVYCDGLFIAIVSREMLYLKTDATTRGAFEQAGATLFTYQRAGRTATLNFHAAPAEALESPALMAPWARLAVEAALRARSVAEAKPLARPRPRLPPKTSAERPAMPRSIAQAAASCSELQPYWRSRPSSLTMRRPF